jgi:hypothetical protein
MYVFQLNDLRPALIKKGLLGAHSASWYVGFMNINFEFFVCLLFFWWRLEKVSLMCIFCLMVLSSESTIMTYSLLFFFISLGLLIIQDSQGSLIANTLCESFLSSWRSAQPSTPCSQPSAQVTTRPRSRRTFLVS